MVHVCMFTALISTTSHNKTRRPPFASILNLKSLNLYMQSSRARPTRQQWESVLHQSRECSGKTQFELKENCVKMDTVSRRVRIYCHIRRKLLHKFRLLYNKYFPRTYKTAYRVQDPSPPFFFISVEKFARSYGVDSSSLQNESTWSNPSAVVKVTSRS